MGSELLCKGLGHWKVYADVPVYFPPGIEFQYPGESKQFIQGGKTASCTPSYDPEKYYYIRVSSFEKSGICWSYGDSQVRTTDPLLVAGDFALTILSTGEQTNPYNYDGLYSYKAWGIRAGGYSFQAAWWNIWQITSGCKINQSPAGWYSTTPPWISQVFPYGDASIAYSFKILGESSEVLFSRVDNVCPQWIAIPEECLYLEDWRLIFELSNSSDKNAYLTAEDGESVGPFLCPSPNGGDRGKYIYYYGSPLFYPHFETLVGCPPEKCDLPVRVRSECEPLHNECPEGTCPVPCGDQVCCYGVDGVSLKSIPLSEYTGVL